MFKNWIEWKTTSLIYNLLGIYLIDQNIIRSQELQRTRGQVGESVDKSAINCAHNKLILYERAAKIKHLLEGSYKKFHLKFAKSHAEETATVFEEGALGQNLAYMQSQCIKITTHHPEHTISILRHNGSNIMVRRCFTAEGKMYESNYSHSEKHYCRKTCLKLQKMSKPQLEWNGR